MAGTGDFDEYELAYLTEEFAPIVEMFANDEMALTTYFEAAWWKLMTFDRYLSYRENACTGVSVETVAGRVVPAVTPVPSTPATTSPPDTLMTTETPVEAPTPQGPDSTSASANSLILLTVALVFISTAFVVRN